MAEMGAAMVRLKVEGMTCEGCVRALTRRIQAAAPGARVRVDLATGAVEIEGEIGTEAAGRAVEEAGFTLAKSSISC
jgi:copper chaperone